MTRTFIALELDETLQHYLGGIIRQMAQELPNIRWVNPVGIHLTMAFLGDLTDERLAEAIQAAEVAAQTATPFEYRLSHLGMFGSWNRPRVIWMGIDELSSRGAQATAPGGQVIMPMQQLHRVLNQELEQRGFEVDKRPFSPHLTLARVKEPLKAEEQQRLQRFLAEIQVSASSSLHRVQQLSVMKSELLRSGAWYTCLRACTLGATQGT